MPTADAERGLTSGTALVLLPENWRCAGGDLEVPAPHGGGGRSWRRSPGDGRDVGGEAGVGEQAAEASGLGDEASIFIGPVQRVLLAPSLRGRRRA